MNLKQFQAEIFSCLERLHAVVNAEIASYKTQKGWRPNETLLREKQILTKKYTKLSEQLESSKYLQNEMSPYEAAFKQKVEALQEAVWQQQVYFEAALTVRQKFFDTLRQSVKKTLGTSQTYTAKGSIFEKKRSRILPLSTNCSV